MINNLKDFLVVRAQGKDFEIYAKLPSGHWEWVNLNYSDFTLSHFDTLFNGKQQVRVKVTPITGIFFSTLPFKGGVILHELGRDCIRLRNRYSYAKQVYKDIGDDTAYVSLQYLEGRFTRKQLTIIAEDEQLLAQFYFNYQSKNLPGIVSATELNI